MKYAVLILEECDTDDSPRNEWVVEAKDKQEASGVAKRRHRFITGKKHARVTRVRRLSKKELSARYGDYENYMNGGYLDYFNPFTGEGYLD